MNKIDSFKVDHDKLDLGIYVSRIDGDIITFDLRMKKPNSGVYLSNSSIHTIEHIVATYVRNSNLSQKIIYFGPMGCRTGFYLICRKMAYSEVINLVFNSFQYLLNFEGQIPGCNKKECGNYLEHDLNSAKEEVTPFSNRLINYKVSDLNY